MEAVRELVLTNKYGLHARPAMRFVEAAMKFSCEVYVTKDGQEVNGKSVMGMMLLAAEKGSVLAVRTVGDDAEPAIEAIARLVGDRFGEE